MPDHDASAPLLRQTTADNDQESHTSRDHDSKPLRHVEAYRRAGRRVLSSRKKHFIIMGLVVLDVAALLANVFIQLIACEMHQADEEWVQAVTEGLEIVALVFSSLFMVELLASVFSFGFQFFSAWFHCFDSAVIVLSFVIDVASRGLTESIGSLIVVLRLWRLAKISEELVLGASERMDVLEAQMDELEHENDRLRTQLGLHPHAHGSQRS